MDDRLCCIFGAGDYDGAPVPMGESPFLIAADGGWAHMERLGLTPHLLVGDFDSLDRVPDGVEILRHPVRKDDTDMALAVDEGLRRGHGRFYLYGGLGGRLDHTMANLQLLCRLSKQRGRGFLLSRDTAVTALTNGGLRFPPGYAGHLSVFAVGGRAEGVTLTGLEYPLTGAALTDDVPLGVSNAFTAGAARIRVERGTLLVMWTPSFSLPMPVHLL